MLTQMQMAHSLPLPTNQSSTDLHPRNSDSGKTDKMETSEISDHQRNIKERMLVRLSETDAHFKHQQRDEPDLTVTEKLSIAEEILNKSLVSFLGRFGKYLVLEDMEYFTGKGIDYEVEYYSKQIRERCNVNLSANRVKNRRYSAMKELIAQGEYFSEEEMKYRDPFLYHNLIGQYLTDDEVQERVDKSDLRFSTILLKHMDQLDENALYAKEKEDEESQMEEEDESEEEEEEEKEMVDDEEEENDGKPKISKQSKMEFRNEFSRIMQERFLAGQDKDFDYNSVDNNTDYDDMDTIDKDQQDKYFNSEDFDCDDNDDGVYFDDKT